MNDRSRHVIQPPQLRRYFHACGFHPPHPVHAHSSPILVTQGLLLAHLRTPIFQSNDFRKSDKAHRETQLITESNWIVFLWVIAS